MVKEIKMTSDVAEVFKNKFYNVDDEIETSKKGFPTGVDGGDGTEYIVNMLTKIAENAGDVAAASQLGGDKMANAIDKMQGVDESVAQTFREMKEKMS